ncbi:MAG TPA: hypothetical protein VMU77_05410, partial [Acidimicrobiales bacterium]|nr:hypothetical protein [Acidimicrobiales bacterium]
IVATPDGGGYWLLTSQGNVLAYGDAVYFGSSAQTGALPPGAQAVAMVSTADGNGYWIFSSSGGVYSYGDAQFEGTPNVSGNGPVVGAS